MQKFIGLIVGLVLIIAGALIYLKNNHLTKVCTVEADAIVVDMKEEMTTDDNEGTRYMYYPIIEFDVNGNKVKATMQNGSNTPPYSINTKLTILYNPSNTDEFLVKGETNPQIFSIVFMALGCIITICGIFMVLRRD